LLDIVIKNATVNTEIAQSWAVVRKMSSSSYMSRACGNSIIQYARPDDSYSLPFILAVSVLEQVLNELIAQGKFRCKSWKLGPKMAASRAHLPWQDYGTVDSGREERNRLAHEGMLLPKNDCLKYIDAIEHELKYWRVL